MSDTNIAALKIGLREIFAECERRKARFTETGKRADERAWKRKGGVLEVLCVGHMRKLLDSHDKLEVDLAAMHEAALVVKAMLMPCDGQPNKYGDAFKIVDAATPTTGN